MKKTLATFALSALAAGHAHAHPGHSTFATTIDEWLHLVLSPDHLPAIVLLALVGVAIGAMALQRRSPREGRRDPR